MSINNGVLGTHQKRHISTRTLVLVAVFSAIAEVIYYLDFPVPLMPGFIKLDLSNVVNLFTGFALGPVAGVATCLIKDVLHLVIKGFGTTMGVGDLFDFVTSATFVLTSSLIYQKMRSRKGAIIGCAVGTIAFTLISLPLNYYVTYPIYAKAFGGMEAIMGAYKAILPDTENLFEALCIFNTPFTFFKGLLCALVTIIIYKPLSQIIKRNSRQR